VYIDPSLFFFFLLSCFFYILYLPFFSLKCELWMRILSSLKVHKPAYLQVYTQFIVLPNGHDTCHFFFISGVSLQETNPLLTLQIPESHNPQTHNTKKDLSYFCIMHNVPLTSFILSRFPQWGFGAPLWFYSAFPTPTIPHPTFLHPLEWLTNLYSLQNQPFFT